MPPLPVHPASAFTVTALSELFTRAYTDYYVPAQIDAAGFQAMVALNDIDLSASRVGVRHGQPVGLALLGVRGSRGWIGGIGVVPAHRGERIGRVLMQAVIESARQAGVRSIDLEVLTQNQPALRLYEALGFQRRRLLDIWRRESDATFPLPPPVDVRAPDVPACLARFDELHVVASPWQRDLPALQRQTDTLRALGIVEDETIVAYVLYRMSGSQATLIDAAGHRTTLIESILRTLIRERAGSPLRFANVSQDDPASSALRHVGAEVEMQQHEMTLDL